MAVEDEEDAAVGVSERSHREMDRLARERGEADDREVAERRAGEWVEAAPSLDEAEPVAGQRAVDEPRSTPSDRDEE